MTECSECGYYLPPTDRFCRRCGHDRTEGDGD